MTLKVVHVITALATGGAEKMLLKLISGMDRDAFDSEVIALAEKEPVGLEIEALGVKVTALGMSRRVPGPSGVLRLGGALRSARPDLVQTWMYHADLIGGLVAATVLDRPILWNVRASRLDRDSFKRSTVLTARACARLSRRIPDRILCCSHAAVDEHVAFGYAREKMTVIPNGFDLDTFRPDPAARRSVREELQLPSDVPVVGVIAAFREMKDHRGFIEAARRIRLRQPNTHFVLAGRDIVWENDRLAGWIRGAGLSDAVRLLGDRHDIPHITASFDIACSGSSCGEGFPNVVGEAMACGVPCVVTDSGDSAYIVGDTGAVVPPRDPDALAEGCLAMIGMDAEARADLGRRARARVAERFSISAVVARYQETYAAIAR